MKNERLAGITDKIYERDSYVKTFDATVLSCVKNEDKYEVMLDITAFFPEGGGQSSDTGVLSDAKVLEVKLKDGNVIHYVDKELPVSSMVTGTIDWERRFRKMQNHSGEHLFCGIIHNEYGYDNVGFHMTDEEVTLDVNGELTDEQLLLIERKVNEAIYENVSVTVSFPDKEELKTLEYRSKLDLDEGVRLVTIDNYDVCACCAPHVNSTGEIGIVKIVDAFFHRGGTRITIRAGISAYEDYANLDKANKGLVGLLSSKRYDTYEYAVRFDNKYHELLEENIRLKKLLAENESKEILREMENVNEAIPMPKVIFSDNLDRVQMRNIINDITAKYSIIVAGFIGNDNKGYDYIIGRGNDINLSLLAKDINASLGGSGGGKPEMIQGHVSGSKELINNFLKNIKN